MIAQLVKTIYWGPHRGPVRKKKISLGNLKKKKCLKSIFHVVFILFFKSLFFNRWKIALQVCVGFCCTTIINHNYIYIYIYRLGYAAVTKAQKPTL